MAVAFWYHLSLRSLPAWRQPRQKPLMYASYGLALGLNVLLITTPLILQYGRTGMGDFIPVYGRGPLFPLLAAYLVGLELLILWNFWQARREATHYAQREQLSSQFLGSALAALGLIYWVVAVALHASAPSLPLILATALAVAALGYGVVRYSAMVEGRVVRREFTYSGALMLGVAAVYLALMWWYVSALGAPAAAAVLIVVVAIVSHSGAEFARSALDRLFVQRPELELRAAAAEVGERTSLEAGLRDALVGLAHSVDAVWAAVVLRRGAEFMTSASYNWRPPGERVAGERLNVRELTATDQAITEEPLAGLCVIAPLMSGEAHLGALLLSHPRAGASYGERDLDLIAETADNLADLVWRVRQQEAHAGEIGKMAEAFGELERELQEKIEAIRTLGPATAIGPEHVAEVEDALRHSYDYSYLGAHPLNARLFPDTEGKQPATHLDRGKALNEALVAAVEKLRPPGSEPGDLPPRQWYAYLVLSDAYLHGVPNRDILGKLYISETTFHRVRRNALRAVTQALFELERHK